MTHPFHYKVELTDGTLIQALLPKSKRRLLGCLFGNLSGYLITVALRPSPKLHVIVDLSPPKSDSSDTDNSAI